MELHLSKKTILDRFFHGRSDCYVRDDYEGVMFRYDAATRRYFRRFVDEANEDEVPRNNKLLFDTVRTGREISRDAYEANARTD